MRRRRLRLRYSSSSEEEEQEQTIPNPESVNPTHPTPLEISDDDFLDVTENLSPTSPPPPPPFPNYSSTLPSAPSPQIPDSPINVLFRNLGLNIKNEWLDSCIFGLNRNVPGFTNLDVTGKSKLCFQQFVFSDMNLIGSGVVPNNLHSLHQVVLPGPFVLQVDEIVNIGCPLKERYKNANAGIKRCLKLSMTDGVQRVFGVEYRPIKQLEVLAPAGLKVVIHNVHVRRGLFLLVPEVIEVLGGLVEDLDAARQRLVIEVNKPPRGKRKRTGSVPSLSSRATLAAWPSNNVNEHANANNATSQRTRSVELPNQDGTFGSTGVDMGGRTGEEQFLPNVRSNADSNPSSNSAEDLDENMVDSSIPRHGDYRERVADANVDSSGAAFGTTGVETRARAGVNFFVPNFRSNTESNPSLNAAMDLEENMVDATIPSHGDGRERVANANVDQSGRQIAEPSAVRATFGTAGVDTRNRISEDRFVRNGRSNAYCSPTSNAFVDPEENTIGARISSHRDKTLQVANADAEPSGAIYGTIGVDMRGRNAEDHFRLNSESNPPSIAVIDLGENRFGASIPSPGIANANGYFGGATFGTTGVDMRGRIVDDCFRSNAESNSSSIAVGDLYENMTDASIPSDGDDGDWAAEANAVPSGGPIAEPKLPSHTVSDFRDTEMADEVEHPLILNGDREIPFTYLANLMARFTAKEDDEVPFVRGNIKCFVTGVKEFQFKGRTTFKLHVYVDDGSLISEVLIDHDVVQKTIGHSPKEVTTALSSPDDSIVTGIRETLKLFQFFLVNFEGLMLIEINNSSPLPVALEMNQGCSSSDTWLLLRRLKMFTSPQTPQHQRSGPVTC
ncbi:hypothetical protein IFM89_014293 [Coptis chinensis]|uniref:RecQ-mediated genome instability protein 1 n=1 Tax=Coptis chinensis TaxID=261450 RepID=A0A835HQM0_9MAGN|nr:hypothetical protein IFM89_014293 [Coptis chinensis]